MSLGPEGVLWVPPGGGLQFGETLPEALTREFKEETGLEIRVLEFLFLHEYLSLPLHAIELFFRVEQTGGSLRTGSDPELAGQEQILKEVRLMSLPELQAVPPARLHRSVQDLNDFSQLLTPSRFVRG